MLPLDRAAASLTAAMHSLQATPPQMWTISWRLVHARVRSTVWVQKPNAISNLVALNQQAIIVCMFAHVDYTQSSTLMYSNKDSRLLKHGYRHNPNTEFSSCSKAFACFQHNEIIWRTNRKMYSKVYDLIQMYTPGSPWKYTEHCFLCHLVALINIVCFPV